jgi:hypothetical protein
MTTCNINGTAVTAPAGAIAYKYADDTEDARWIFDESDLAEIVAVDPSLVERVIADE